MRELAKIARIQKIEPIKDKDRIELATIENYPVIVEKGKYKVNNLVVYVFYDTVLPQRPEFEFLRARCWSKMYQGFRIRNMSMAGHYSSGIIFDLDILPKGFKIVEGKEVSKVLDIVRYDPDEMLERQQTKNMKFNFLRTNPIVIFLSRFRWFRRLFFKKKTRVTKYPKTVKKSDEENIEKLFNHLKQQCNHHKFYLTEKMEGQSATYMLYGRRRKFLVFSRNTARNPKGDGNWENVARQYDIEKILKSYKTNYAIQGEICKAGVQGNIYGFNEPRFFVYKVTNTDTGKALDYLALKEFCSISGLDMVPVIATDVELPETIDDILSNCQGYSVFENNGKKVLREGVVWRSMTDQNISFKAKSREYAVWFEKRNKTR